MTPQSLQIGRLSASYLPGDAALLVLSHGAGADHQHPHMTAISQSLQRVGLGTLRFNFPFMEDGRRRVDSQAICLTAIAEALSKARELSGNVPILVGGHSFGGRMSTHFAAANRADVAGVVCYSFPLHPAKKPAVDRATHLHRVNVPQLYLSGNRDTLAYPKLLEATLDPLPQATLHWLDTADHGFKILKRTRQSAENVYDEAARIARTWFRSMC